MDSVTQAFLGACVAGACAPSGQRRKAMLLGAALGTLPDMDVLIRYDDAVANMTYHRGFSHSLLVLAPFSLLLWTVLWRLWPSVRGSPRRWLAAISLTLLTHPLLDAHTIYGTQLLWPIPAPPVMWSTLFIIDPLYSLPLVLAVGVVALRPRRRRQGQTLMLGLLLSTLYLGWSWVAKLQVERTAAATLAELGLKDSPRFSVPTPLNTVLWRIVVLTDDGYLEGFHSLFADDGPVQFVSYPSNRAALEASSSIWAVQRLRWFAHDFVRASVVGDELVLTDLRMGLEPNYVFSHAVAARGNPHWRAIDSRLLPARFDVGLLRRVWARIWTPDSDRSAGD